MTSPLKCSCQSEEEQQQKLPIQQVSQENHSQRVKVFLKNVILLIPPLPSFKFQVAHDPDSLLGDY